MMKWKCQGLKEIQLCRQVLRRLKGTRECLDFVSFCFLCFSKKKGPDCDSYAAEAGTIEGRGWRSRKKGWFFWCGAFSKVMEFVTILLLFLVFVFWPQGMWDSSSPKGSQIHTPCIGRWSLNHWTAREVPIFFFKGTFLKRQEKSEFEHMWRY